VVALNNREKIDKILRVIFLVIILAFLLAEKAK